MRKITVLFSMLFLLVNLNAQKKIIINEDFPASPKGWSSSERTQESIHAVINNALIKDEDDLSGWFSVSWDADSLYVWAQVQDDILWGEEVNAYENDNIIVFVDLHNKKTTSYVDATQRYWEIYWYENNPQNHFGRIGPNWGLPLGLIKTEIDEDTGYTLNLSVAWSSIDQNFVPEVGRILGFDVKLNDHDGKGRKQLAWYDLTDTGWDNPSVYGVIRLAENGLIDYLTQRPLPPNVTLTESGGNVTIQWTAVEGAHSYRILTPGNTINVNNETFTANYYIETYDNYIFTVQALGANGTLLNQSMSVLGAGLFELKLMVNPENWGTVAGEGRFAGNE
ncbi:MAG: hypothetical protein KGZ86_08230 [Candidatus Latescibacteria bacterium]|nr:hypothetical protein [Candidatus Latescibacterota bacterium]